VDFQERIAMNEAGFRRVNEARQAGRPEPSPDLDLICECGRLGCTEHISVPSDVYTAVRADPRRFMIVPGHEVLAAERVVETHDGYLVVEKTGEAGGAAARTGRPPLPDVGL
jgi:hypothetical protein